MIERWQHEEALWLLWLLPIFFALGLYSHRRVREAARRFAGEVMESRLMPPLTARNAWLKTGFFVAGVGLCIVAMAGPSWDHYFVKRSARGLDVAIVLDVSRSMLADDGGEPRLERARSTLTDLVTELGGDRVGLILFAGDVLPFCPLTLNRSFLVERLREAAPELVGRGGTRIGPALDAAFDMLDRGTDRDRVVLLVTDAGDQDSFPKEAGVRLKESRIRVVSLGIGRTDGRDDTPLVLDGKPVRDRSGNPVSAKVNEDLLKSLAVTTEGMYVPPTDSHRLTELFRRHISPLKAGVTQEMQEKRYHVQYQWWLLPGILCLLLQAGRSAAKRRPRDRAKGVPAAVLVMGAALLAGCGGPDEAESTVLRALEAMQGGDVEGAIKALQEVEKSRSEDAVVAFDLGCAHQGAGHAEQARRAYSRALDLGHKELRARTWCNLGLLDASKTHDLAGESPEKLPKERRREVLDAAQGALASFQRARDLDPTLEEAKVKQALLARWIRVQEDRWAAFDREEAKKMRHQLKGVRFVVALAQAEEQLIGKLSQGELFQNLALEQADLLADLDLVPEKLKDNLPPAPEKLAERVAKEAVSAGPLMEGAREVLAAAQLRESVVGVRRARAQLVLVTCLWDSPETGLAHAVQELVAMRKALTGVLGMPAGEARRGELLDLADAAGDVVRWIDALVARVAPGNASESWHPLFLERARSRLNSGLDLVQSVAKNLSADPGEARRPLDKSLEILEGLLLEWSLAQEKAGALARRLEGQAADLRSLVARADPVAAGASGRPVEARLDDQVRHLDYLDRALAEAVAPKVAEGEQPTEQQLEVSKKLLEGALRKKNEAATNTRDAKKAWEASGWPPDPSVLVSLASARQNLRDLFVSLTSFEELLDASISEQEGALESSQRAEQVAGSNDELFPRELQIPPLSLEEQARSQGAVTRVIRHLVERLPAERQAQERRLPAKEPVKEPKAPEPTVREAPLDAAVEEARARLMALEEAEAFLTTALEGSGKSANLLLPQKTPAKVSELKRVLFNARHEQEPALAALREARAALERARLPLARLAHLIMRAQDGIVLGLSDVLSGRVKEEDVPAAQKSLLEAQQAARGFVKRLSGALRHQLAAMSKPESPPPSSPEPPKPPDPHVVEKQKKELEQAKLLLEGLVQQVETSHGESLARLSESKAEAALPLTEQTLEHARNLWLVVSGFEDLLKQAVPEQQAEARLSQEFGQAPDQVTPLARSKARKDQERTRSLIDPMIQRVQAQGGGGQGGGASQGLPPEVKELAMKNLPLAQDAMDKALEHVDASVWPDANKAQEDAARLLQEILDKLPKNDDQQQPQQQPKPKPDEKMSDEERERLMRAVQERNRDIERRQKTTRKRTPVEEDW